LQEWAAWRRFVCLCLWETDCSFGVHVCFAACLSAVFGGRLVVVVELAIWARIVVGVARRSSERRVRQEALHLAGEMTVRKPSGIGAD
jgi:hypothetical protein